MSRALITAQIEALDGRVFPAGFGYPPASQSSPQVYGRIRRLYAELRAIPVTGEDWAVATLGPDGWTIGAERYTKDVAEEHADTLRVCDCEALAVRAFQ